MKPRSVILLKIWALAGGLAGLAEIAAARATGKRRASDETAANT